MDKDGRDPTRDTEEVDLPGPIELRNEKLIFVGPLPRVRPRNGILALVLLLSLRSEFIGEL